MKKIGLLLLLVVFSCSISGCSCSSSVDPDPPECPYCGFSWQREDFASHLSALSYDPEGYLNLSVKYNRTKDLEDASVKLHGFIYGDDPVAWTDADDAVSFLFAYIDALHAEIDKLCKEYEDAY